MSKKVLDRLVAKFGDQVVLETSAHRGDETARIDPSRWREVALFLRDDPECKMEMLADLCGVDWIGEQPRLEVVAHLHSLSLGHRLRIKTRVGDAKGDGAEVPSLVPVWSGANWFEREAYDMFGIRFTDHPDLRRILLYEEFEGHPLRKDYPAKKTQPLVPYRQGVNSDKQPPFQDDEGMSFGRKHFDYEKKEEA